VPIACLDLQQVLGMVSRAVEERQSPPLTVSYANAHTCNLAWADPMLRSHLQRMDLVYVDGNGPRIAAWLQGRRLPRRMTGADWIHDLCAICVERGFGLFLLGAPKGVAGQAADRLRSRHPGLQVRGTHSGYFSDGELPDVLRSTVEAKADIVLVGMRSPEQEAWIIEHASALGAPVVWGTGGMLEYVSGSVRRPPRWMRRLALEWLGRMLIDPTRLTRRYVLGVPAFLARATAEGIQARVRAWTDTA
jgi:exopolysaccharide biosynthesis WecB/TagA/CpsF family protein